MQINTGPTDKNCSNTYQIGETNNISLPPSPLLEKPDQDRMTNHANSAVRDGTTTKNQQESPKYATVVKDDDRDGTLVAKQTPSFHTKYYQKTRTKNPIQMPPRGTLTKTLNQESLIKQMGSRGGAHQCLLHQYLAEAYDQFLTWSNSTNLTGVPLTWEQSPTQVIFTTRKTLPSNRAQC